MKLSQFTYLGWWWFRARLLGRRAPLQSVIFISDKCNLSCKHCSVYNHTAPIVKTYGQIREELEYCYSLGSRFVDFEGGEPFLWSDSGRDVNSLCDLAHEIGFFSCTITTNAQKPFAGSRADSIWMSMDGVGEFHERVRGKGTWERFERNIAGSGFKDLSVNMVVNTLNRESLPDALEYVKASPFIRQISFNLHTPFPGTEYLALPQAEREAVIDEIIAYKKRGYPVMNSVSGLKNMKYMKFRHYCWMTNFIFMDGTRKSQCIGEEIGNCD